MRKNQVIGATLSSVIVAGGLVGCSAWTVEDRLIDAARAQTNGEVVSSPRVSRSTIDLCSGDSWELQPREIPIHFVPSGERLLGVPLPG